jgi:hypothetical protein
MRRTWYIVLMAALACDTLEPIEVRISPIENIQMPAILPASDTLLIRFNYTFGGCEEDGGVRVEKGPQGITIMARNVLNRNGIMNCPDILRMRTHFHFVFPAERTATQTFRFRQPTGSDSIRVVRTQ